MPPILDHTDGVLNAFTTRFVLSAAIMMSLLMVTMPDWLKVCFLILFGVEVVARAAVLGWRLAYGQRKRGEVTVFLIAFLATVSFVPIEGPGAGLLLTGRFARLALLLTYWGPLARDFVSITLQRERLSQMLLVSGLMITLTAAGAAVLRMVHIAGGDIHSADMDADETGFLELLWWSFRQVLDPGNLVSSTTHFWVLLVSLALTVGGLLLIAVLIGIGATLVEDLVRAGRSRRVGLSQHTVVLNASDQSLGVLVNVTKYFSKQVRWRHVALQGPWDDRPRFLESREFRSFHYRGGRPADTAALELLDTALARRIAVLASGPDAESDADAVTAVLSARMLNDSAWIVVELNRPGNIPAALKAGRHSTVPVPARRLAALVLAQELVDPGRAGLLKEFVSLTGQEIYSCIFGEPSLDDVPPRLRLDRPFDELRRDILREHHCLLIGYFLDDEDAADRETPWLRGLTPILNPRPSNGPIDIRGLIAVAPQFDELQAAAERITKGGLPESTAGRGWPPDTRPLSPEPLPDLRHVIVLGFHDDTVELVGELLRIFPQCEVTIVGQDEAERGRMRAAFLAERTETGASFQAPAHKKLQLVNPDGRVCGRVNIRVADRYADGIFRPGDRTGPVGSVFDYDAAVLLAERGRSTDPDAGTTLGVLKLLDEWSSEERRLDHVVAELSDPHKEALLQRRVQALGIQRSFSFVCTSTLRQNILSHSFFVPGLPPILHNLMTAGEEELFALQPTGAVTGELTYLELVERLGREDPPLVPLAVVDPNEDMLVNPAPQTTLQWSSIRSVICLGTVSETELTPPRSKAPSD